MNRLMSWLQENPKRIILLVAIAILPLGLLVSQLNSGEDTTEGETGFIERPIVQAEIVEPEEPESEPEFEAPPEDLPAEDNMEDAATRATTDLAMTVITTYLNYSYIGNPKLTLMDIRTISTDELYEELAIEIAARDWEGIQNDRLIRFAEVENFEFVEYFQGVPVVMQLDVSIYSGTADNMPESPNIREKWEVSVELVDQGRTWAASSIRQIG